MERIEIKLAGSGGQGLLTAGKLLAEAALLEGKRVVEVKNYGPEARLGSSSSDVIISDGEIYYPKTENPDAVLLMNQESYQKFGPRVREGGIMVVDTDFVQSPKSFNNARLYAHNLTTTAKDETGYPMTANILGLAVIVSLTGVVKKESLAEAIKQELANKEKFIPPNLKALDVGFELGKRLLSGG
ncbi:MAG: 2-oxoacid:acceptor oxidoreductase family protein [candidate division WOR-3 bacterium]